MGREPTGQDRTAARRPGPRWRAPGPPVPTPSDLVQILADHPAAAALAAALDAGRRVVATGVVGSSLSLTAAAVVRRTGRHAVLLVAHADDADEALDELTACGVAALRLPAIEALPGESNVSLELFAERLSAVRRAATLATPTVIIAPIQALMQVVPAPARLGTLARTLRKGDDVPLADLVRWLAAAGYKRLEAIEEPGDFALRGGILDVFPPTGPAPGSPAAPVRLDFFGDTLDRLAEVDLDTMASDRALDAVELVAVDMAGVLDAEGSVNFLEVLPRDAVALLAETMEVVEQGRGYYERVTDARSIQGPPAVLRLLESRFHALAELNGFSAGAGNADVRVELPAATLPAFSKDAAEAVRELAALAAPPERCRVVVCCQNDGERQRLSELLTEFTPAQRNAVESVVAYLHRGFIWRAEGAPLPGAAPAVALVPYHELLSRFTVRRRAGRMKAGRAMDTFLDFQAGDYVVHAEQGIARFIGLQLMKPRDVPSHVAAGAKRREVDPEEYLTLEFAAKAKLHVPATQIDKVQKYVGGFHGKPPLSTLGGQKWKNQKERVAESVKDLAAELLRVRAAREHLPGIAYPADTPWQAEFEAEFPYEETQDQLAAMQEIKRDMQRPRPMDRLICGDVGFGKTELAIRAAFKACEFGRQVAVLVPTTVLAEQHERTFRSRFSGYPFKVASISRFKTPKEVNETLDALRKGHIDLIIGTHRLLSKDVHFADLGLVVIDEEQRFGVDHKEGLLRLRLTVDVLTLSATPIPRTLHMAMLGIRDISSLTTAPLDRRAIVTEVIPYNERRIEQAIARELSREGQVYVVHNKVHDIMSVADDIRRLAPGARVAVGHGQMPPGELEDVMLRFIRREADILVATTIIESGIDIASANTMIIDDADRFGLADLHQLRGRVGRSKHRAYCYLLLPADRAIKEVAQKRLKALEQFSMLGAGFKIAMRDLEIRGAGNILGAEQSGHIAAVGYEMYCRLLEESVHTLNNDPLPEPPSATSIEIGVSGLIPKSYIPSDARRLEAYRRLATAADAPALDKARKDLIDAYGEPPRPTQRLFDLAQVRIAAAALGVRTITIRERDLVFRTANADALAALLAASAAGSGSAANATVRALAPKTPGDLAEVYFRPPDAYLEPDTLLAILRRRLGVSASSAPTAPAPPTPAPPRPAPSRSLAQPSHLDARRAP